MDSVTIGIIALVAVVALVGVWILRSKVRKRGGHDGGAVASARPVEPPAAPPGSILRGRLASTRSAIAGALEPFLGADDGRDRWEALEDALILADVGPSSAAAIVEDVKRKVAESGGDLAESLSDALISAFFHESRTLNHGGSPGVVMVVGVNGAGKTTTIAKIAHILSSEGRSVLLGAADTFRPAADTQLIAWGERAGVPVVSGKRGQDPASVAFAAIEKARSDGIDIVIIDTAGRLHAHANLMDELGKIFRVAEREAGKVSEVLLVLDGSTGQNGIAQARAFTMAVGVTGVVLTKLDGTAKGGVAVAVEKELGLPIKYIGIGEGLEDMIPFVPKDFVEAMLE